MKIAIVLLIAFVVLASLGLLFSARPTPVLGVDGDSLAHSISNSAPCIEGTSGGVWNCWRNSTVGYRVEVGWDGCWDATLYKAPRMSDVPRTRSGCIDIWDHLELEDTFN